jgi:hypothetical protein
MHKNPAVSIQAMFISAILVTQVFSQPAAILEKSLAEMRKIKSLRCSIIRKQSYSGVIKTAQCSFYYDRQKEKYAYIYASPYEYSFWADDSTVCGVERGKKRGYRITAAADSLRYHSLIESIHLCEPVFHFEKQDTLHVSLKASIDDFLFFDCPAGAGKEVIKINRNKNLVDLIETFDSTGALRRQTIFEWDTTKGKTPSFPKKIISRGNSTGAIETDTLIFSKVEINKSLKESVFAPPPFANVGMGW